MVDIFKGPDRSTNVPERAGKYKRPDRFKLRAGSKGRKMCIRKKRKWKGGFYRLSVAGEKNDPRRSWNREGGRPASWRQRGRDDCGE